MNQPPSGLSGILAFTSPPQFSDSHQNLLMPFLSPWLRALLRHLLDSMSAWFNPLRIYSAWSFLFYFGGRRPAPKGFRALTGYRTKISWRKNRFPLKVPPIFPPGYFATGRPPEFLCPSVLCTKQEVPMQNKKTKLKTELKQYRMEYKLTESEGISTCSKPS
jgi:hypothetical protein